MVLNKPHSVHLNQEMNCTPASPNGGMKTEFLDTTPRYPVVKLINRVFPKTERPHSLEHHQPDSHLTMAPQNQPDAAFYATTGDKALALLTMSYPENPTNKLGIYIPPAMGKREVFSLGNDPNATRFPCNEPKNEYAKFLLAKIADKITTIKNAPPSDSDSEAEDEDEEEVVASPKGKKKTPKRISERQIAITVMKEEAARLNELAGFGDGEPITTRMAKVYWHVLKGFTDTSEYNETLDDAMFLFVKIRLGMIPRAGDEFQAAMMAFQEMHKTFITDTKFSVGLGYWTLPLVHLLNGHMIQLECTPIAFHQLMDKDKEVEGHDRRKNSKPIYVNRKSSESPNKQSKSKKKKRCTLETVEVTVERRTDVIAEWIEYALIHHSEQVELNLGIEKPVNPEPPAKKPKNAQRGLSLDL